MFVQYHLAPLAPPKSDGHSYASKMVKARVGEVENPSFQKRSHIFPLKIQKGKKNLVATSRYSMLFFNKHSCFLLIARFKGFFLMLPQFSFFWLGVSKGQPLSYKRAQPTKWENRRSLGLFRAAFWLWRSPRATEFQFLGTTSQFTSTLNLNPYFSLC